MRRRGSTGMGWARRPRRPTRSRAARAPGEGGEGVWRPGRVRGATATSAWKTRPPTMTSSSMRKNRRRRRAGSARETHSTSVTSSADSAAMRRSRRMRVRRSARMTWRKEMGMKGRRSWSQKGMIAARSIRLIGCRAKWQRAPVALIGPLEPAAASSSPRPSGATTSLATYSIVKTIATKPSIRVQPPHGARSGSDCAARWRQRSVDAQAQAGQAARAWSTKHAVDMRMSALNAEWSRRPRVEEEGRKSRLCSVFRLLGGRTSGCAWTAPGLAQSCMVLHVASHE